MKWCFHIDLLAYNANDGMQSFPKWSALHNLLISILVQLASSLAFIVVLVQYTCTLYCTVYSVR